jgi:predicted amidohydrolase
MVSVALLQVDVSDDEAVAARVTRVLDMTRSVAAATELVVLPELWHVGAFNNDALRPNAQSRDGELVESLRAVARDTRTWIHAGSFVELVEGGRLANTSLVLNPAGEVVAFYRKIHLFGFDQGEAVMLDRGHEAVVVPDTPVGSAGIATCYDLRFPELFSELCRRGAEAVVLCSGWPTPRINHWRILIQARAIENQTWFIACNEVGRNGDYQLGGNSMVVDPKGEVVAEAGSSEEVLYADVDPKAVDIWRRAFPILRDRVM